MPTLDWIGKSAIVNHHNQIPFRLLRCDPQLSVGDPESGNLLIEGDNLEALKALLPYYAGQVKLWVCNGKLWEMRSGGQCLFIMPKGPDYESIRAKVL